MTAHVVIACGKSKALAPGDGRTLPLAQLYTGNLFRARRAFAEALTGEPTLILSAFHGARRPAFPSAFYDRTMTEVARDREWRENVRGRFRAGVLGATSPGDVVILLAGAAYLAGWLGDVERAGRRVLCPTAGLPVGRRLRWLSRATAAIEAGEMPSALAAEGVERRPAFEVLRTSKTRLSDAYGGELLQGQVTELRYRGRLAWVRENLRATSLDHFMTSSGERLRRKVEGHRHGVEVLELAAPPDVWADLAALVAAADACERPVIAHPRWTVRTAPEALARALAADARGGWVGAR